MSNVVSLIKKYAAKEDVARLVLEHKHQSNDKFYGNTYLVADKKGAVQVTSCLASNDVPDNETLVLCGYHPVKGSKFLKLPSLPKTRDTSGAAQPEEKAEEKAAPKKAKAKTGKKPVGKKVPSKLAK